MRAGIGWPADKRDSHALPRLNLGAAREADLADSKNTDLAVSGAKRLNDCFNELSEAIAARPPLEGDRDLWHYDYTIEPSGKSEMLALLKLHETFSANSIDPVNARANELLKYLGSVGADNEARYNAALSFIESMKPQDQAEALLLVQMYCTHDAAIRALSQLGSAEWVPTAQTFGNLATKLLGTSQRQMETLARMRRGGEQVVKHIHVDNRGGQAVIAENVNQGGGTAKNEDQCHGAGNSGSGPALLCNDAQGDGVPIPSRERAEAVPYARRDESRRA